ncbi:MAG: RluA family pseudouridine synthase [Candidatus Omnitrophica bacterium]|nr:RluA family pseudouridine synthase [Candidatus Omnitrophota bacterium]MDD5654261.1 RluA family pseudouridine synthase [Candidatus Omnitrophota bacterium]
MRDFILKINDEKEGMRLDVCLFQFFQAQDLGLSRTTIQKEILEGHVTLAGAAVKANHKVKPGDAFEIKLGDRKPETIGSEDIPLDIVYEDDFLAVINKPCGLVVHPAPGNKEHTLVNALLHHFKNISQVNPGRPGIVHRLDKDTSGLMLAVKDDKTHLALAQLFARHDVKRQYVALVRGSMEFDENIIEVPLGRHPTDRKKIAAGFGDNTKYAKTHYRTLKRAGSASLIELTPFTGRTHQLRVHLAFIGHPILGDNKYGRKNEFPRLALHAFYIGFIHPATKKFMEFSTPIPQEFTDFVKSRPG